ncbi:cyclin-dependent kinase, putative [Eimeria mitis]|uniref:Cyclin-dependent kinases regulatory subunit n=1 Tax=Eimeria mitis TaxID=44415 RepID=U6JY26_9EIME|nr:cyclin-dependent kinase, putative [Eimeria mitis]CDJ30365.1 cyclin-dependent kinase, putative [Eimeria mitis]
MNADESHTSILVATTTVPGHDDVNAQGHQEKQHPPNGVEVNALQSQLLHRQLQQRQQHRHAANMGLFCNPGAGQRAAGIFYRAAAEVSAIAAAAGAAAVACECVRHKAAQAAAALHPWSPRTLLPERVAPPSAAAAATIAAISPATEAVACGRKPIPACSADETNGAAAAAAAAAEASRAAFLREELLNLAESRYTAVFVPVDEQLLEQMNDEFIRSDISRYPVKNTPSGIVFYSPRYSDDRFIYRHVLLSAGVKKAAEEIANATKSAFLTEGQFIYQLGIHLSPGWEHFMIFKGEMRELILRRPQQQQESQSSQNQAHSDEVSEESDDSEPEEPITTGAAPESQPPPPRHQELGRLLQQIAENATIHQVRHQKNLLQQQMAISRAVEKANRLLLLIVQLQRPPQHVSPKMLDRMKCLLASYFFSSLSHFSVEEEQQQSTTAKKYLFQNGNIGKQEAPHELQEKRFQQQEDQEQDRQSQEVAAADDGSAGSGSDAAALANVALPRGLAAKGKAPNQPANATGGINSPTSQRREKRRRYPVKR